VSRSVPKEPIIESVKFRFTERTGKYFHAATKTHDWPSTELISKISQSALVTL